MFWPSFIGCLGALLLLGALIAVCGRPLLNLLVDRATRLLFTGRYHENVMEMANIAVKINPMDLVDLELRCESDQPLARPFGARRVLSDWAVFRFNPVYVSRPPIPVPEKIDTTVVLGPRAARPLRLSLPIMIGGMAWGGGLSARTKIALARGAAMAGTAANTGSGPFLPAERAAAGALVIQLSRAAWMRDPAIIRQADMIEIQLGHGAIGSAATRIKQVEMEIDPEYRAALGAGPFAVQPQLPEGGGPEGLKRLAEWARSINGAAPVGVKLGATDVLEEELAAIIEARPDFIVIDGMEGGTHGICAALQDQTGLPTLHALVRADRFLRLHGRRDDLSLLIGGGLYAPGQFLTALALGADAVIIGTAALLALAHRQLEKVTPWEPPTQLLFHQGKSGRRFDPDRGAVSLANFLRSCAAEMSQIAQTLGRTKLSEVGREDLCCLDRELAMFAGVRWAGCMPAPEVEGIPVCGIEFQIRP